MINGPNMYGYVGGHPIMYYDPYGLFGFWDVARPFAIIVVVGAVGAIAAPAIGVTAIVGGTLGLGAGVFMAIGVEVWGFPETVDDISEGPVEFMNEQSDRLNTVDDLLDREDQDFRDLLDRLANPCPVP